MEAVRTNILGTENVISAASEKEIEKVVVLNADKAVYPINALEYQKLWLKRL